MNEFKWIERHDVFQPLDQSFVDQIASWYQMDISQFEQAVEQTDKDIRHLITATAEYNRKRMKTYASKNALFDSDEKIASFLALNIDILEKRNT